MTMKRSFLLIAAVLPIAACDNGAESTPNLRAPPVEVAGEPVNCILTSRIQNTVVHDDYTIDFDMLAFGHWPSHLEHLRRRRNRSSADQRGSG